MSFLSWLGGAIAWLTGIVVLIKLFQKEGILKGILGLICMIYTYIWGWTKINDAELNMKTLMYVWTGAIVLGVILSFIGSSGS